MIKENEIYGKYRPMYLNRTMYNHPLGFNLYNINNSKENIKRTKKACNCGKCDECKKKSKKCNDDDSEE